MTTDLPLATPDPGPVAKAVVAIRSMSARVPGLGMVPNAIPKGRIVSIRQMVSADTWQPPDGYALILAGTYSAGDTLTDEQLAAALV